jgi:hypothetical protein
MFPKAAGSTGGSMLWLSSAFINRLCFWHRRLLTKGNSSCQYSLSSSIWNFQPKYPCHQSIRNRSTVVSSFFVSPLTTNLYGTASNPAAVQQYSISTPVFHKGDNASPPASSPFASTIAKKSPHQRKVGSKFIPRKAAVQLSERARVLFQKLLTSKPGKDGILLNYHQSSSGEPRMVFSFQFVTKDELVEEDEG